MSSKKKQLEDHPSYKKIKITEASDQKFVLADEKYDNQLRKLQMYSVYKDTAFTTNLFDEDEEEVSVDENVFVQKSQKEIKADGGNVWMS